MLKERRTPRARVGALTSQSCLPVIIVVEVGMTVSARLSWSLPSASIIIYIICQGIFGVRMHVYAHQVQC